MDKNLYETENLRAGRIFRDNNDITGLEMKLVRSFVRNLLPNNNIPNLKDNLKITFNEYAFNFTGAMNLKFIATNSISQSFDILGLGNKNHDFIVNTYNEFINKYPPITLTQLRLIPGYKKLLERPILTIPTQSKEQKHYFSLISNTMNK